MAKFVLLILAAFFLLAQFPAHPVLASAVAPPAHRALLLSSLEKYVPLGGYAKKIVGYLESAGYNVTYLRDKNITVDFIGSRLGDYEVVVWRTNAYAWNHVTYWYVGELATKALVAKYSAENATEKINFNNGIVGVSAKFFYSRYGAGSLAGLRLAMIVGTNTIEVATPMIVAGAVSAIEWDQPVTLWWGMVDYVTMWILRYLAEGKTVYDSVFSVKQYMYNMTLRPLCNTINETTSEHACRDQLDQVQVPPVWYIGAANTTLPVVPAGSAKFGLP